MAQYIDKTALVAEIEKRRDAALMRQQNLESIGQESVINEMVANELNRIISFTDTLEVKEVEETEQRMKECPFRQDVCNRYKGTQVKCDGRCSWVVDYPKLKELKAQKGEL